MSEIGVMVCGTAQDEQLFKSEIGVTVCDTAQDEQLLKSETSCLCSSLGRLCSFSCCPGPWIRFWYSLGTSSGLRVSSETHRVAKGKSRGRGETAGRVGYVL